jgi:branched-chain amino acid transport system ATP-binding protein
MYKFRARDAPCKKPGAISARASYTTSSDCLFWHESRFTTSAISDCLTKPAVPELLVDDVHTYYGDSYVLQGVSLSLAHGAVVAVLGRNGVGKTTLMRTIIGFTPPRRGRVLLAGEDVTQLPAYRIAQAGIALVPQGRRVFASLTVRENLDLAYGRSARDGRSVEWTLDSVLDLFPRLRERLGNRAGTLSGGEQQMLAIARALIAGPKLLLMDEPTEGLSPYLVEEIRQLLLRLKQSRLSILLVEQNVALALAVADLIYIMDKGRVVCSAAPDDLAANEQIMETYLGMSVQ